MIAVPDCIFCRHYLKATGSCAAFPDGVPEAILLNGQSHRDPYPGDHGIQLELKADLPTSIKENPRYNRAN